MFDFFFNRFQSRRPPREFGGMRGSMGDDGPPAKFFRGGGSPGWGGRGGDRDQNGGGFRGGRGQGNYTQRPSGGGGWGFRGKLKNLYILS